MARRDGGESVVRTEPVVARTRRITEGSPLAALRAYAGPRTAWFSFDGTHVVGCEAAAVVTGRGPDRFLDVRNAGRELLATIEFDAPEGAPDAARPRLFGGFAFLDGFDATPPWRGFPGARFVLPRVQVVEAEGETWLTVTAQGPDADPGAVEEALDDAADRIAEADPRGWPTPGIVSTDRVPDRAGWRRQVESALDRIDAGELEKVVLAQRLTARLGGAFRLPDVLARLGETYPDCFRFAVDPGMGSVFFGATPERLVTVSGRDVTTEALAGSIGRGGTPEEDDRLASELADSEKVQHEHGVVAEAIRDRLADLADDVAVGEQSVRRLANVQHLRTPITASFEEPPHVLSLVEALHPTPAVGGLPPEAAQETIAATEEFDRGWYAAPVGWFDAEGDGTFAVGIRSGLATNATATLFAGNGIVADSDPDEEWDELQLKYRPILDQLG